jgi:hypothetical protein
MNPNLPPLATVRAQVTDWLTKTRAVTPGALIDSMAPAVEAMRGIERDVVAIVMTLHEGLLDAERDAAKWEATANTWRAFAVDVASMTGACDPDDVGVEDLRGLAGAVERLRAFALEVALQVAPLGEEQRAAQTTVRDLPAVTEALREVVAERDRADQRADRAHAYKVVAENEAAALRARAEAALATARAEGAAAERAAVVRMLGKYRDHAERLGLADESVVLAEVLEVIDAEAHLDQPEGA